MSSLAWEGQIFKTGGSELFVNAGSNAGIVSGMSFDAFERKPISGKGLSLGAQETQTGTIEITDVFADYATARATTGTAREGSLLKQLN